MRVFLIAPLLAVAVACGAAPAVAATTPTPTPYMLGVMDTFPQGRVFTDQNFETLYANPGDDPATGTFACTGACLQTYQPLLVQPGTPLAEPAGVAGTLGTTPRPDQASEVQVTVNGEPVYTYVNDLPGDTGGVTAVWHVVLAPVAPAPAAQG
jgi:predicted lipoprotein with Yx(FWY)xxD motif